MPAVEVRSLYKQVTDEFVRRVLSGDWKPGMILPNELQIAKELNVSLGTVRKAFDTLTTMQMFTRIAGKGTTVSDPAIVRASHRFINTRDEQGRPILGDLVVTGARRVVASEHLANVFGMPADAELIRFDRTRVYRGRVFTTEIVHIPVVHDDPHSLDRRANLLWFDRDVAFDKAERIEIVGVPAKEAETLKIDQNTSVIGSERIIYGFRQRVLEHRAGYIHIGKNLQFMTGPPEKRLNSIDA